MSTIKDSLDIINKLTPAEQEHLKTILLSNTFIKTLNIEEFVTKERFTNGSACPLCGATHVVRNGHRKDGTQKYVRIVASFLLLQPILLFREREKTFMCGNSTVIVC